MQPAHCLPEACVVTGPGAGLGLSAVNQYSDYVTVSSHQPPDALSYSSVAAHPTAADFTSAMYVNTVWGPAPDQPPPHPQGPGVYYDSYPPPVYAGYPGHMLPGQDGSLPPGYPGMPGSGGSCHEDHHIGHGKRKRRRVITYEQRKAANVRERKRMCHLNDAFDVLRKRVPTFAYEKKLSRIETLKLAVTYIQYMGELLEDLEDAVPPTKRKRSRANKEADTTANSDRSGKENSPVATAESEDGQDLDSVSADYNDDEDDDQTVDLVDVAEEMCSSQHQGSPRPDLEEMASLSPGAAPSSDPDQ